jgi:hypothetical protein
MRVNNLHDMPNRTDKDPWPPELEIQFFKEVFTAVLALVIIGATTVTAFRSFNMVGDATKMGDAKDLLTIMLGVAGVVLGYYFGRVPSDARAAQATNRADEAVSQREEMKTKAKNLAGEMDGVMTESTQNATRNGQPPPDHSRMRTIRDKLLDMAVPAEP